MGTVNAFPIETTPFATALQTVNLSLYKATSASSLAIGTGPKTFTTQEDKDFVAGDFFIATSDANPSVDFMYGTITSYTTDQLVGNITQVGGSGTHADWTIRLSGPPGPTGDEGPTGPSGAMGGPVSSTDNAVARFNGPSGTQVQNSGVIIDDSDNVTGVASITLPNTGLKLRDTNASHSLTIAPGSDLTADRILTITTGDAPRTLDISAGSVTITAAGAAVLDDANAAAQLVTLGAAGQGKQTVGMPAGAMTPRTTNGAAPGSVEMATNKNMVKSLDFDASTQEYAQFEVALPKSWNNGTVTFIPIWSHASTTTNFGVVWSLAAVATSDGDALDVAFGTAQTSTDTGGSANTRYIGPESSPITIAGSPATGDVVQFQISRVVADAGDTMAIDARLHKIKLLFTTNAPTDA